MISPARCQKCFGDLAVPRGARELVDDVAVPIEPEPFQPIEDRVMAASVERSRSVSSMRRACCRPCAGIEPVEQGRARAADVEEAGRRGRKAGDDR